MAMYKREGTLVIEPGQSIDANFLGMPREILYHILSFFPEQERMEIIQQLRGVCKHLQGLMDSPEFLKAQGGVLFFKQAALTKFLNKQQVIDDQIQDWKNIRKNVVQAFDTVYLALPQTKQLISMAQEIKNTELPARYYFSALRSIMQSPLMRFGLAFTLLLIIAAIAYSSRNFPLMGSLKKQINGIENELEAEGCIFESGDGPHSGVEINSCNDTIRMEEWQRLLNKYTDVSFGPVFLDSFAVVALGAFLVLLCCRYPAASRNQPNSYAELQFNMLEVNHHKSLTALRNDFQLTNQYQKIQDVIVDLEDTFKNKKLPRRMPENITEVKQAYDGFISIIDKEIKYLEECQTASKFVFKNKLENGELKTKCRGDVYKFIEDCQKLSSSASAESHDNYNISAADIEMDIIDEGSGEELNLLTRSKK